MPSAILVASIFLGLIFSAYVCHVTTAGSLGDQVKCDNQSINQYLPRVASMVSYWPQLTSEDDDIAGFVFSAKAVACRYLNQSASLQMFQTRN